MSALRVTGVSGDRYDVAIRGHSVVTDQPVSAGGGDEGPTPTELFVASLAACVAFYVGRFLRRHSGGDHDVEVVAEFRMSDEPPSRVAAIDLRVGVKTDVSADLLAAIKRVAEHCTVHNSLVLSPGVTIDVAGAGTRRRDAVGAASR